MPQEFDRRHSVAGALRRAALADIEAALGAVTPAPVAPVAPAKAVHVMRRRLKRLRALIRLPHAHLADFGAENRAFRDLGRRLAGSREAEVLHKTYDALVTGAGLDLPDAVKAQVTANDAPLVPPLEAMLADTLQPALHEAAGRIRRWRFDRRGFALIGGGLERTYRQMRLAGLTARDLSTPENLHEWRKQVKYHAAQLRLLAPVDPEPLEAQRRQAIDLARLLASTTIATCCGRRWRACRTIRRGRGLPCSMRSPHAAPRWRWRRSGSATP